MDVIGRMRKYYLPLDIVDQGRFARCQLRYPENWYTVSHSAGGIWGDRPVDFNITIRPLFTEYAVAIYRQVLKDALAYYPNFMRHEVVDGPLVGERRLVFPDQLDEAASYWMESQAWDVMENSDIAVPESCTVRLDPESGAHGARFKADVKVLIDRPLNEREIRNEVAAVMAAGKPFPTDPVPRKCHPGTTMEMFTELSLPELVLLNWDQVRKKPTPADHKLHEAVERFDLDAVKAALAEGADPNSLPEEDGADTMLTKVVGYKHCERHKSECEDWNEISAKYPGPGSDDIIRMVDVLVEAGAAVDWSALNTETPLAEAALSSEAPVVQRLLDLGADPSIRCYDDQYPGKWGSAWNYAEFRCDDNVGNDDETIWNSLLAKWPAPFGECRR